MGEKYDYRLSVKSDVQDYARNNFTTAAQHITIKTHYYGR